MSTNIRGRIQAYTADGAIAKYRIAKFGAADGAAAQAAAATDKLLGVTVEVPAAAAGDIVDVVRDGLTPVEYGGNVARGDALTADANGKAVAITLPVAAESVRVIGHAEISGAAGDIGGVDVSPYTIYGGPEAA